MKQIRFPTAFSVFVLRLAMGVLIFASANQSVDARENHPSNPSGAIFATSAADGGRLVIKRSPVLGWNVSISLMIDGKVAGTLVRGQTFDRYITPGRHILRALPNASGDAWQGTLDVHAGDNLSYTASYNVNKIVLTPVTAAR
jgi:hypothetical protein